jgi:flagellar biosynthesis/type III secretory pathway protein FliH
MYQVESNDEEIYHRDQAREYITSELTRYSVEILEFYNDKIGKNESLAITIESLSETLGNLISLVKEEYQQEVMDSANQVIHQGLISQQEIIAQMAYGQLGHA